MDRFHLVADVIDGMTKLGYHAACVKHAIRDKLIDRSEYITSHGDDLPKIRNWHLPAD